MSGFHFLQGVFDLFHKEQISGVSGGARSYTKRNRKEKKEQRSDFRRAIICRCGRILSRIWRISGGVGRELKLKVTVDRFWNFYFLLDRFGISVCLLLSFLIYKKRTTVIGFFFRASVSKTLVFSVTVEEHSRIFGSPTSAGLESFVLLGPQRSNFKKWRPESFALCKEQHIVLLE